MPRGRHTALTITLTPDERAMLTRWQRSAQIPETMGERAITYTAMPQELAHDFGMDPLLQKQCRSRVAQVVKPDVVEPGFMQQWPKGLP